MHWEWFDLYRFGYVIVLKTWGLMNRDKMEDIIFF